MTVHSASRVSFDVLAIVTSAGGLEAMSVILADLPADLPAAVVIGQHLGADSALPEVLYRRTSLAAGWAREGESLRPGRIYIAPPRMRMELLPDGTVALAGQRRSVLSEKPLDALLTSLADSYGARVLAVVLTGMGRDGAAGARAVKAEGGAVLVQSELTAAFPEMPRAAIEAGAADLVLPLVELGRTIVDLMAGGRFPRPRNDAEACDSLFAGPGPARAALREVAWADTEIGPVLNWPGTLKSAVASMLNVQFPMCVAWGADFVQIYNDAWITLIGNRHPGVAGLPARVAWQELWTVAAPQFHRVMETGEPAMTHDYRADTNRHGFVEEVYLTTSISPLHDNGGAIGGLLLVSTERTGSVLAERRLQTLRRLAELSAEQISTSCERTASVLEENPRDVPFALLYLLDAARLRATLCGAAGLRAGTAMAPRTVELLAPHAVWPLGRAARQGGPQRVDGLATLLRNFHSTTWDETPQSAMVLPLQMARGETGALLVVGISPRQAFDDVYRGFVDGIAQQVATNLAEAQLRERDRERMQQLALMDRARAEFFSNVSHEFRTPLTLILAPLEDMLSVSDSATDPLRRELEVATRNAHRLFNLVDTLLDFSRIEAGRLQARFQPVDLSALTIDISSLFRSAVERAGLELAVDCTPAPEWTPVDVDMWEKVLSNLLSNALKFTFDGRISVRLRYLPQHVQLEVSDTGVGIPAEQQGHVFSRFHRVRGMRARTDEGLGLGLSIVSELVRLHQGRVRVRSTPGEGSTFTVWIRTRLPVGSSGSAASSDAPERSAALQLADEAGTWSRPRTGAALPAGIVESMIGPAGPVRPAHVQGSLVLVVDDNADMRDYLARILASYWRVDVACDGAEALVRARARRPDLIVADVMMPVLDGFGMLRALRSDNELRATPVVLVTARAHEEAAIEGLLAGADDYVSKPFSSRELVARIGAQLELARVRRRGEHQVRELLAVMPVGVYACDTQGRFSYWNRRAVELWGGEPGNDDRAWALLGAPQALTPEGARLASDASAMAGVLRTGEAVQDQEVTVVSAAGSRLDLLMNIRPLREEGMLVGAVCAFLDVTARKAAERALQTLNDELEERAETALREREAWLDSQGRALQAEMNGASLETSLGFLIEPVTARLGEGTRAAFYLADSTGATLHHVVGMSPAYAEAVDGFRIGPESPARGLATPKGCPVLTPDVMTDPLWESWRWLARQYAYRGCWSFPIHTSEGRFVGSFAIYSSQPREATQRDIGFVAHLIQVAAIIISRHAEESRRREETWHAAPGGDSL